VFEKSEIFAIMVLLERDDGAAAGAVGAVAVAFVAEQVLLGR
jgi:hypothetical protein